LVAIKKGKAIESAFETHGNPVIPGQRQLFPKTYVNATVALNPGGNKTGKTRNLLQPRPIIQKFKSRYGMPYGILIFSFPIHEINDDFFVFIFFGRERVALIAAQQDGCRRLKKNGGLEFPSLI
jgi:hypothetical protein